MPKKPNNDTISNSTQAVLSTCKPQELAAEGQRFRQQGKLCFELAVRAEALHSEVTADWEMMKYGGFHSHGGSPIAGQFIRENTNLKWMIWGYP